MNKILRLFLMISLLITCFTVNVGAENNNTSEVPLQSENGELDIYSVEQIDNGDIVLTFNSKEYIEQIDVISFVEVSKTKAGPTGVFCDSFEINGNIIVIKFDIVSNILQLKKGSTYKVYVGGSINSTGDVLAKEIQLQKGANSYEIEAFLDENNNLIITSTNSFITDHIARVDLYQGSYIEGYDSDLMFIQEEIGHKENEAYISYDYLGNFNPIPNVDYEVTVRYEDSYGSSFVSNALKLNSIQFNNFEQKIGPELAGYVKDGILFIESNNSVEGKEYLDALYEKEVYRSYDIELRVAAEGTMCGFVGFYEDTFEPFDSGLKMKLHKCLYGFDYDSYEYNELILRVPGKGMSKVIFSMDENSMKTEVSSTASINYDGTVSIKVNDKNTFEKIMDGLYTITYSSVHDTRKEQSIQSKYLTFDKINQIVYINSYLDTLGTTVFYINDKDALVSYAYLDGYYWDDEKTNGSCLYEVEANSTNNATIIDKLKENENFSDDNVNLLASNIIFNTRVLDLGNTNVMQTWLPYFLANTNEVGVDYSNSIPIRTYIDKIDFKYENQVITSARFFATKPYSLETNVEYGVYISSDSFSKLGVEEGGFNNLVLANTDDGTLKEIDYQIKTIGLSNGSDLYYLSFSHPFSISNLILYNRENTKKPRKLESPVVYAFENDFEGMKTFVDAQLKDGWKVFNKIDDIEQKLYPYYNTDKYLVGVINEGENGYVDVYKVLETNWVEIPEIQAIQDTKGNIIISYKDINKVADYNDFLSNMSPEFSIKVDNEPETIFNSGIRTDNTNKTWTLDYGNIFDIADKLDAGVKYNITIIPSLFGVKLDSTKSVDCYVTINKNSPVAKPVGSLDNGIVGVLNSDAKTHLNEKHPGSSITINRISTSFNSDVSKTDIDKYFKSFGLSANNSISLNIYLSVDYTTDGTSHYTEAMPYEYSGKYVDLSINVSLDAMAKLGITKENYSTQEIVVLREHNGEVTELPATLEAVKTGETIISFKVKFKTDKMSLFSVANKSSVVRPSSGNPSASTKKPVVNTAAK